LLALIPTTAQTAEICVKCTGPDANYDCVVNKSGPADTVTKLYCITALAKAGPHASCAIDRNSVAPCQGERKEFTIPAAFDGVLGGAQQQEASSPDPTPPAADAAEASPGEMKLPKGTVLQDQTSLQETPNEAPPKTVQEMVEKGAKSASNSIAETQKSAGNAAKTATTALEKAGSAVGSAAKTSWKCLSSFFSNC
jgi:hypothetical protein